ncbi:RagB/SusD family nutrient uptake outer membrane protein [termite gut metagenome]|uniref:RagB/SusD family nutrient uptake outer membrane protein n=1 Tax=termite gut metagenome TaxID=433724 RepID=A0A5J4SGN0_9ZZZZ
MKRIKYIYILSAIVLLVACQDDLLDTNPYDAVSSGKMWTSESLVDQGVIGVYNILREGTVGLGLYVFEAYGVAADSRDVTVLTSGNAIPSTGVFLDYWKEHYEGIHRANDAIKNLPESSAVSEEKKARLIAECKFLRAYFYYKLNLVYKGVPLYLEPLELADLTRPRELEETIWQTVITDLTDCIAEPNLPNRYEKGNANYGHITKSAAYALRGKVYLCTKEWSKAEADFKKVGELGHKLFEGGYKQLFKEANEQCEEMIFSVQCTGDQIGADGATGTVYYGNQMTFRFGSRVAANTTGAGGGGWNTYLVNTDFVDTYENKDGRKFNWDDVISNYTSMTPAERSVYFLRNGLQPGEITTFRNAGAKMDEYDPSNNEARITAAYTNRDPRLLATVITPYSTYLGSMVAADYTFTLRWPYRSDAEPYLDIRTDTNTRFYYLFRKFVGEGTAEVPLRRCSPIDVPLIRYADVVLSLAEALNEQGKTGEAIAEVNKVRKRAGLAEFGSAAYEGIPVGGQDDVKERIQNERRWEFAGEGVSFFDEFRLKTWKKTKFGDGSTNVGLKQVWGDLQRQIAWAGDQLWAWPIPLTERQMNSALEQNPGWIE